MAKKLMHALQYSKYGGGVADLKHVEVPVPTPSKGEVLIKYEAIALNPVDWKTQDGFLRPFSPSKFPHIPSTDVSGEVLEVGPGVKNFKQGDKVVAMLNTFIGGGLAEYGVAKANMTVLRPPQVSAADGASLPVAGLTAHQAVLMAGVKLDGSGPRRNVLITAASGGVGHYAVQLAKLGNAHVTATCGARNLDIVRSLGADEVIDYKTPEGAALKSPSGTKYDAVIQCAGPIAWSVFEPVLSSNGKVINITPSFNVMCTSALKKLTFSKKKMVPFFINAKLENLQCLVDLSQQGKLKTVIDCRIPLSRAEEAWTKSIESHATGKIIVEP